MPINILVVGGAGYIGSHMVLALRKAGYQPIVLDNLSKGHPESVIGAELVIGDMADAGLLELLFSKYSFDAVMHFASLIEVGESMQYPLKYYENNVVATLILLKAMLKHQVKNFIFSSTAAVYGEPVTPTIKESHPLAPVSPYGRSKMMVEEIVKDLAHSDGLRYSILRYFNAAGADAEAGLAEQHDPESHLIPLLLQVVHKKRKSISIFGNNYPTLDGTCIRDYIHVTDLCQAHLLALEKLLNNQPNFTCNLGTGLGHSVFEVIKAVSDITHSAIPQILAPPRRGDVAVLVADPALSQEVLSWTPKHSDLKTIISDAFKAFKIS